MNKIKPLYKACMNSYLMDPLFYCSSILTVLFCTFRFFFGSKFFVMGIGSTDLRPFFNSFPYISIITVPLLVLRLNRWISDDSLPLSPFSRFCSLLLSSWTSFALPLFLSLTVPACISIFGDVDSGQLAAGIFGILLYGFCALSLVLLLFTAFKGNATLPLLISAIFLAIVNFIHLLPLYMQSGSILTFFGQNLSFAWHFDSFSKGIFDSRDIFYYLVLSFIFILLAIYFEYKRTERKVNSKTVILLSLILIFCSFSVKNLYFRLDSSSSKQFTVSSTTKELLANLNQQLRITYFRSKELKNLYPQTSDVYEYLVDFSSVSKNVSLTLQNADSEKLKALGIQGQQIKSQTGTKTEYVTVFSAIYLQYGEKSSIIPFVLSTQTLEYDLAQRLQQLITEKERNVYLLCGNGREISESYAFVEPWLASRGFKAIVLDDFSTDTALKNLTSQDSLAIFGSMNLNTEQVQLISQAISKGTKAFICTSQYTTDIENEWKVSKNENDNLLRYLNSKGFALESGMVEDLACYPLTMESGEGSSAEFATMNYPLWLVIHDSEAKQGITVFWASPISLYNNAQPLLKTSKYAWLQNPAQDNKKDVFLTNPFLLPKSAKENGSPTAQYIVGAKNENIVFISDQFFLSSMMTGFISGETSGDFRNYDFFVNQLLKLRGEEKLAELMEKSQPQTTLYKITDSQDFEEKRIETIFINFTFAPLILLLLWILYRKKKRNALIEKKDALIEKKDALVEPVETTAKRDN
ncbi:MAG: Gldg family protein [Treponema sp.]|nr:Gldg family protein [Candidatus Treponema equifaecale]